jgi:uncharacterized membrane protein YdjX (TVP38/TMEM64 family)
MVHPEADNARSSLPSGRKVVLLVGVLASLLVAGLFLPVARWVDTVLDFCRSLGLWGMALLVGIYILACVVMFPGAILTLGIGAVYGLVRGTLLTSLASTAGATAAMLIGRHVARRWVQRRIRGRRRFEALDEAVSREGFKVVVLTRLSPVFPFSLVNYAFGLTGVGVGPYVLGSWLGMLPGTLLYVYLGSLIGSLAQLSAGERPDRSGLEWALLAAGMVATLCAVLLVTRSARRVQARKVADEPSAGEPSCG